MQRRFVVALGAITAVVVAVLLFAGFSPGAGADTSDGASPTPAVVAASAVDDFVARDEPSKVGDAIILGLGALMLAGGARGAHRVRAERRSRRSEIA